MWNSQWAAVCDWIDCPEKLSGRVAHLGTAEIGRLGGEDADV